jgi:predicted amidophosphoribosyltransferase
MSTPKCARCQQPLPQASGYCVACGCTNDLDRLGKTHLAINQRQERSAFWRRIVSAIPFLRFPR